MKVFINRKPVEADASASLDELLAGEGIAADGIAVAVNNRVVPRSQWAATELEEGAKITVIHAVCGG